MNFLVGYNTDKGNKKDINQDSLLIRTARSPFGRIGLFAVCDGMGGLSNGELASATVVRDMSKWFESGLEKINLSDMDSKDIYNVINKVIFDSNKKLLNYGEVENQKLGTTLSMLLVVHNSYYTFQIGDSRIYKIDSCINQLTIDQSFVQREIERGNMTIEEGKKHPKRNVLLQCIGAKSEINPVVSFGQVNEDDVFMICSDGFYRKLSCDELFESLNSGEIISLDGINKKLVSLTETIKDRKEIDNISAIVIKVIA